jgi:hypothetical protein
MRRREVMKGKLGREGKDFVWNHRKKKNGYKINFIDMNILII